MSSQTLLQLLNGLAGVGDAESGARSNNKPQEWGCAVRRASRNWKQREVEEARAASARWPVQPNVTTQIEAMTRQMHLGEVPMNTQDELERVFPSGEEDAGMRVFPSGEEDAGSTSRQPPAAGLVSRQQDTYFIPPPSRVVGGARGRSVPVSTATLGLIHRQDPNLAAQLRENPASMMQERTRHRVYSTIRLIRTGLIGQMASLQQWEEGDERSRWSLVLERLFTLFELIEQLIGVIISIYRQLVASRRVRRLITIPDSY